MHQRLFCLHSRLLPVIPLLIASSFTLAESGLDEIIVTADFRGKNEMETPHSVSVLGNEEIDERGAQHIEDLVNMVPNINFAGGTGRARFFQIRGIGERSQFSDPLNHSVGVLIDNVDFSGAGSVATLFDVAQVEVLRGPQGTRYGANALAGLINIKTNDPEDEFGGRLRATGGDYGTRAVGAAVTGPLSNLVSYRLTGEVHESDGYTDNSFLDRDDVNARDETTVRGRLRFDWNDESRTDLTLGRIDIDNGYDAFSLDNTRTTLSDEPGHDRQTSSFFSLHHEEAMDSLTIAVIGTTSSSDLEYGYDEDWSYTGIHPFGYTSFDNYIRERSNSSAEVRMLSNESSTLFNGTTDWVVGAFRLDSSVDLLRQYTFAAGDFTSTYDFTTTALFFQLDTRLSDTVELTSGLRWENRDTSYVDSDGVAFSPDEGMWGGQLALRIATSDNTMTYVSLARGYKAGGFNTDGTLDADLREFDSEFLWEIEAGIKGVTADGGIRYRAAVFYDLRRDQQVKSSLVRPRMDGSSEFIDFTGNAAEGTNLGMELEADFYLSDAFAVYTNVGLLQAEFDEFINEFGEDLSGRDQAQTPGYMFSVGMRFDNDTWFGQLGVDAKDSFFFSDRHSVMSGSNTLVNGRTGYRMDNWTVSLWGRNLTDEDTFIRGFGSFGNDPRKDYVTEPYLQFGEPRVVGLTAELDL